MTSSRVTRTVRETAPSTFSGHVNSFRSVSDGNELAATQQGGEAGEYRQHSSYTENDLQAMVKRA